MNRTTALGVLTTFLVTWIAMPVIASELDPVFNQVPQGLVVKIAEDGKREVFKANLEKGIVENSAEASAVLENSVKPENQIQSVTPGSELDQVSSDDSWHWNWNSCGGSSGYYNYGYSYRGSYYNYYPSYSYNYGGYQYNYYYTPVHYGYHSGSHWSDQSGYHYGGHNGWHGRNGHGRRW